jgi:cation:H+ antiporter
MRSSLRGARVLIVPALYLVGGIILLWLGAEVLIRGASLLGTRAGVSPIVVGLTVVSVGTSLPELAVCVIAVLQGSSDLAVGNIMGSNLANIGLVLGTAAVIRPLRVRRLVIRREVPWMIVITFLTFPVILDLTVGRLEGTFLALVLILYLFRLLPAARKEEAEILEEQLKDLPVVESPEMDRKIRRLVVPLIMVAVGSLLLVVAARGIVMGATEVAEALGVSELLIGLSVLAVGTSLPELATTSVAAFRRQADLAVGNIVGSNIFNLTLVLGGTALVRPLDVPRRVLMVEYPIVLILSLLLLPLASQRRHLGRREGALFLMLYALSWLWIARASL